jgi:hypothetical protein
MRTDMIQVALRMQWLIAGLAVLLGGAPASASGTIDPVVIIQDGKYLAQAFPGENVFVASRKDAYHARADLERYVWARMKAAKSLRQSFRWRQVLLKQPVYIWHCGGHRVDGSDFVSCSLSRYEKGREAELFRDVMDGGTDYCHLSYSLKAQRVVRLVCNSDD